MENALKSQIAILAVCASALVLAPAIVVAQNINNPIPGVDIIVKPGGTLAKPQPKADSGTRNNKTQKPGTRASSTVILIPADLDGDGRAESKTTGKIQGAGSKAKISEDQSPIPRDR